MNIISTALQQRAVSTHFIHLYTMALGFVEVTTEFFWLHALADANIQCQRNTARKTQFWLY